METLTRIRRLSESDSVQELARILGGAEITQTVYAVSYTHLVYGRESQNGRRGNDAGGSFCPAGWNGRKAGDERNPSGRILPDLQRRHGAVEKMQ